MGFVAYLAVLSAPSAGCQPDRVVLGQLPPPPGEPPPPPCDGSPAVLAHIPGILLRPMAIDEENFYVVAAPGRCDGGSCDGGATPQTIWRVPQTGAPPTRLVQGQDRIGDIVPFGSAIYWTTVDTSAGDVATGVVWKIGLGAGDAPERVVKDRPASGALAVASPWILWAEQGVDLSGGPSGRIMRVGIDGGPRRCCSSSNQARFRARFWSSRRRRGRGSSGRPPTLGSTTRLGPRSRGVRSIRRSLRPRRSPRRPRAAPGPSPRPPPSTNSCTAARPAS